MSFAGLNLDKAVARICHSRHARKSSPYFLILGAGVSVPSVPLAWEIKNECKQRAQKLGLADGEPPSGAQEEYSYWLTQAYPDPDERRAFFRKKIEYKPISQANLRIAHLLGEGALTRVAVTSNFDDFLARSLRLFGIKHVVCDHPATSARLDLDGSDVQVVHVHGTYWFYDLINTDDEIIERATGMRSGPGIRDVLDDLLRNRVPLVVGYSGWEKDVIMTALKERLKKRLRHQLYWFCYSADAAASLPKWLSSHPNVSLVLPKPSQKQPAEKVLDSLIRAFELSAPALTRDPLAFFAKRLAEELPMNAAQVTDPYLLRAVVERVELAAKEFGDEGAFFERTEKVRDAIRRSRYGLARTRFVRATKATTLSAKESRELLNAFWPALGHGKSPSEDLKIYRCFIEVASLQKHLGDTLERRLATAYIGLVATLDREGRHQESARQATEAIGELRDSLTRMPRAMLRLNRLQARALLNDGQLEVASEKYRKLLTGLPHKGKKIFSHDHLAARREYATALIAQGRVDLAKQILAKLIRDLSKKTAPSAFRSDLEVAVRLRASLSTNQVA